LPQCLVRSTIRRNWSPAIQLNCNLSNWTPQLVAPARSELLGGPPIAVVAGTFAEVKISSLPPCVVRSFRFGPNGRFGHPRALSALLYAKPLTIAPGPRSAGLLHPHPFTRQGGTSWPSSTSPPQRAGSRAQWALMPSAPQQTIALAQIRSSSIRAPI